MGECRKVVVVQPAAVSRVVVAPPRLHRDGRITAWIMGRVSCASLSSPPTVSTGSRSTSGPRPTSRDDSHPRTAPPAEWPTPTPSTFTPRTSPADAVIARAHLSR